MAATHTPPHDRIIAVSVTVLVHALVAVPFLLWQGGGRSGHGATRDADGEGSETWIAADFVGPPPATPTRRPVAEVTAPSAPVEAPPVAEPTPAQDGIPAGDAPAAATTAPADARQGGGDGAPQDDLGARYLAAVRAAVLDHWNAQGGGAIPAGCKVRIDQVDGGQALRAWVLQCGELPMQDRIRLETAVMQVRTLPYAGFEPVFKERLELEF